MQGIYNVSLTRKGFEKLKFEYDSLKNRYQTVIGELREHIGEHDEDMMNVTRRFELEIIENQLKKVDSLIKRAKLLKVRSSKKAKIGSVVTYKLARTERRVTLVEAIEADPFEDRYSVESPVGKALLGKRVDDKVTVKAPAGEYEVQVISIE